MQFDIWLTFTELYEHLILTEIAANKIHWWLEREWKESGGFHHQWQQMYF